MALMSLGAAMSDVGRQCVARLMTCDPIMETTARGWKIGEGHVLCSSL
jgi:hypothetical protein